jgi:diadenosine tetraphosphate (Ap4A) HIT family hydrolase
MPTCPFCCLEISRILISNQYGIAFRDGFPISPGHTLIIPRHHVASLFDLNTGEQQSLWELVAAVRANLMEEFHPDGFNVGLNDGPAAGQTVMHAHIHVIPRYKGDAADPRGGVRWIIPTKAAYWRQD